MTSYCLFSTPMAASSEVRTEDFSSVFSNNHQMFNSKCVHETRLGWNVH
jgi:hypothetical protein